MDKKSFLSGLAGVFVGVAMVLVTGQSPSADVAESLSVRELRIINDDGLPVTVLGAGPFGEGAVIMFDPRDGGTPIFSIEGTPEGAGHVRVYGTGAAEGVSLIGTEASVAVWANELPVAMLGIAEDAASGLLSIMNKDRTILHAGSDPRGQPLMFLYGPGGSTVVSALVNKEGGGRVMARTYGGEVTGVLGK